MHTLNYFNRFTLSIGILLAAVVFSPDPGVSRASAAIHDFAHAPIFGCIALLILSWLRSQPAMQSWSVPKQYIVAFVTAFVLGLVTEIAQMYAARDASWIDLRSDALGAAAFCGLFTMLDRRIASSTVRTIGVIAAVALLAWHSVPAVQVTLAYVHRSQDFPSLIDARDSRPDGFASPFRSQGEYTHLPTIFAQVQNERALRLRFGGKDWVGLDLDEPYPDWSGYRTMNLDLTNPNDASLRLAIRVHDRTHNWRFDDRFNHGFTLAARTRATYSIALADIERAPLARRLDLKHIANVQLFTAGTNVGRDIYVSRIWLE
ncbi:MAG TPA: VanZ family protein [Steroidobacteraceae bacterium]|nr:VanZ family protein [Steroidobacteraceae bacterium]